MLPLRRTILRGASGLAARQIHRPLSSVNESTYIELPAAWAATYDASSQEELLVAYKAWAPTYDNDSVGLFGYRAPARAAVVLSEALAATPEGFRAKVLDVGAGTGLVGENLVALGHDPASLSAVDLSPQMLNVARAKGCYLAEDGIICCDLEGEEDDTIAMLGGDSFYDAAVSVGTFTPNHAGKRGLDALVRCVRPQGLICLSLRDDFIADTTNGFQEYVDGLVNTGVIEKVAVTDSELYTPNVSEEISYRCWIYAVGASGIRAGHKIY